MKKRKIKLGIVIALSIIGLLGLLALQQFGLLPIYLLVAVVLIYLAYKPMIPTPAPIIYQYDNRIRPLLAGKPVASPKVKLGGYEKKAPETFEADFYIAVDGDDVNDGSKVHPFKTFDRAKEAVRKMDKSGKHSVTVAVKAGEYFVSEILFEAEDGGSEDCPIIYKAHGGEVILNGGFKIPNTAFSKVTDSKVLARLHGDAKEKVQVADLGALGLTKEDIGKVYTIGAFHTAKNYDGDWLGPEYCELFVDNIRQTLARYPDKDIFLKTGKPLFTGGGYDGYNQDKHDAPWEQVRNPKGDTYAIDEALANRIASWSSTEDVWLFGYWKYDWADASTPFGSFDKEKKTLSPMFASLWGTKENAPYYFFNVLEELDVPGEWYIDRHNLLLYWYPPVDVKDADICLSITCKNIIKVEQAEYLTFDGFTIQGTRGDAVAIEGNYITICNCLLRNVTCNAIVMRGYDNIARNNEITRTGKGGIIMDGGDRETLTPGNSIAENNLIYSWSEIYKTYCPAVCIKGVGNICRHNEMYDSPHEVIWYHGNNHLIEYNHIHHACLLTLDGGAIYAGKNWSYYGSTIRYNCIHDIGSKVFAACAIYMDDGISGQNIYGNLMVNIPGMAIQLGGGRDFVVKNNIAINCMRTPMTYDNRAREGAFFGGWFHYCSAPGGLMWELLHDSPYKNEAWQKAYPQIAAFYENFDQPENLRFVPNPGCSTVCDNVFVDMGGISPNIICKEAKRMGTIKRNNMYLLKKMDQLFINPEAGDYRLAKESKIWKDMPDFKELPFEYRN